MYTEFDGFRYVFMPILCATWVCVIRGVVEGALMAIYYR